MSSISKFGGHVGSGGSGFIYYTHAKRHIIPLPSPPDKKCAEDSSFAERADAFLSHLPSSGTYKRYNSICKYCKTEQYDVTCKNCGAPQERN